MRHHYPCIDFIQQPANDTEPQRRPPEAPSRVVSRSPIIDRIPADYVLSGTLKTEANAAGVLNPEDHLARLRTGPIGGARGIFADQLDNYLRSCFGKWRIWEETDRARTKSSLRSDSFSAPPVPSAERLKGWPAWVRKSTVAQLKAEGRDAAALAKLFATTHHIPVHTLDVSIASQLFEQFIERVRKEAA